MKIAAFYFVLFAGPLGAPAAEMGVQLWAGPFPSAPITSCYALAALAIDHLNEKHPDKDFRAQCLADPQHADPAWGLTLQELVAAATASDP